MAGADQLKKLESRRRPRSTSATAAAAVKLVRRADEKPRKQKTRQDGQLPNSRPPEARTRHLYDPDRIRSGLARAPQRHRPHSSSGSRPIPATRPGPLDEGRVRPARLSRFSAGASRVVLVRSRLGGPPWCSTRSTTGCRAGAVADAHRRPGWARARPARLQVMAVTHAPAGRRPAPTSNLPDLKGTRSTRASGSPPRVKRALPPITAREEIARIARRRRRITRRSPAPPPNACLRRRDGRELLTSPRSCEERLEAPSPVFPPIGGSSYAKAMARTAKKNKLSPPSTRSPGAQARVELMKRLALEIESHDKILLPAGRTEDFPTPNMTRLRQGASMRIEARFPETRPPAIRRPQKVRRAAFRALRPRCRHAAPMLVARQCLCGSRPWVDFVRPAIRRFPETRPTDDKGSRSAPSRRSTGLSMCPLRYEGPAKTRQPPRNARLTAGRGRRLSTANIRTPRGTCRKSSKAATWPAICEVARRGLHDQAGAFLALNERAEGRPAIPSSPIRANSAAGSLRQKGFQDHGLAPASASLAYSWGEMSDMP